jgi:hypothetical protein
MSNTIIELRHSYVTGNVPSSLANGEIAINTFDGKLFYRGGVSNTIQTIERYEGPAGLDGEVQFNDSGVLGSSDKLTFNKSTGLLRTTNLTASNVTTETFIQFGDGTKQYTANAGSGSSEDTYARSTANAAFDTANAAFDEANTSTSVAGLSYDQANTATTNASTAQNTANLAFDQANTAISLAQSAYDSSNLINSFSTINVSGQNDVVATQSDTLVLANGSGITITTDAQNNKITISSSGGGTSDIWIDGNDFGSVTDSVTTESDLGSVTDSPTESYDLGGIGVSGVVTGDDIANFTITGIKLATDIDINTTGNITVNEITANTMNGQLNMAGNIIPTANATYDLGSPTNVWRDLYLSNSTIYLGDALISASGENLVLPSIVQIGEATISSLGSDIVLSDNVHIGEAIISSLGSDVVLPANVHIGETLISSHGGSLVLPEITFSTLDISGNVTAGNISTTGALSAADATFSGNVAAMSINPIETSVHDLGTANLRWRTVYTSDLDLNNGIGDWTIVEGEEDLFLYNNKKNKVYKFALIEVSPEQATPKIDGLK